MFKRDAPWCVSTWTRICRLLGNKRIETNIDKEQTHRSVPTIDHNIFGNVGLLGQSIQWFKTMTTNEYIQNVKQNNWPKFHKQLWQSRFHDRIIRTEKEYWAKRIYVENNPENWGKDINNKSYNM